MALGTASEHWYVKAACRGPASPLFFPPASAERREEREAREQKAKDICTSCAVRTECLDFALRVREPHGIWGGLTEHERRRLLPAQV